MWHFIEHRSKGLAGFLLVITLLGLSIISFNVSAHALDFASLNVKQTSFTTWQIHFQQTNSINKAKISSSNKNSELRLQLPSGCEEDFNRLSISRDKQESRHWQVSCTASHPLKWITIEGSNNSQIFFQRTMLEEDTNEQLYKAGTTTFEVFGSVTSGIDKTTQKDATSYLAMGIEHIAIGYDHLAFVLLAILIAARMKTILMVITAFTIGHCLTLVLSSLNLISINQAYVEWLIALSIVFLAVEIIRNRATITLRKPALIALLFGLVHGLGFASILAEAGLPADNRILSLVLFNMGVEIGQLVFVLVCLPLIYWLTRATRTWPKKTLVYSVGSIAGYWILVRAMSL